MKKNKKQKPKKKKKPQKKGPSTSSKASPSKAKAAPEPQGPELVIRNWKHFEQEILDAQKPAIVDFWAEWCGPCKAIAPHFRAAAEAHGSHILFAKVDTERCPKVAEEMDIRSLPTLLAFHEGEVIDVKIGAVAPQTLEKWVLKIKKRASPEAEAKKPNAPTDDPTPQTKEPENTGLLQKIKGWFGSKS